MVDPPAGHTADPRIAYIIVPLNMLFLGLMLGYVRRGRLAPARARIYRADRVASWCGVVGSTALAALWLVALPLLVGSAWEAAAAAAGGSSGSGGGRDAVLYRGLDVASIDFCEDNFATSSVVAEPTNTVSSLVSFCWCAVMGLVAASSSSASSMRTPTRYRIMHFASLAVGIGSGLLHGTLLFALQPMDELPMLYILTVFAFSCYVHIYRPLPGRQSLVATLSFGWCCFSTFVYLRFQEAFVVFILQFLTSLLGVVMTALLVTFTRQEQEEASLSKPPPAVLSYRQISMPFGRISSQVPHDNVTGNRTPGSLSPEEARLALFRPLGIAALIAYGLGSSCWCLEMTYCADMIAGGASPLGRWVWQHLLHTCWHCGAALGAHLLSQLLIALWASREGLQPRLAWWGVPVVVFGRDAKNA